VAGLAWLVEQRAQKAEHRLRQRRKAMSELIDRAARRVHAERAVRDRMLQHGLTRGLQRVPLEQPQCYEEVHDGP
jgi:hypothetical protein